MSAKQNILIIDDHAMMREFLASYLSRKFEVHLAEDGIDALEWLETNEAPSLIIVDIDMPRMNGYDFLQTVQNRSSLEKTALVVLSSASESESRIKAYELGAMDVIMKPFNPRELELKLAHWKTELNAA